MNLRAFAAFRDEFLELVAGAVEIARRHSFNALVSSGEELAARIREERFYLSVLGEIKRGKSSLINAFLGADVLPKAATICTAALCVIAFGEVPSVTVFRRDGTRETVDPSGLRDLVTRKNTAIAEIDHVEIFWPLELLREGVVLIDTPGVNDTDEFRRRVTEEFIPRSDGVLFVLNAGQPLSESERRFLADEVLAKHIRKVWFVVNGIDRVANDQERDDAIAFCRKHLAELVPEVRLQAVSSKNARAAQNAGDAAGIDASGIPTLTKALEEDLVTSRRKHLFDVPIGRLEALFGDIERGLGWAREFLERDRERREASVKTMLEDLENRRKKAERLLEQFRTGIEATIFEIGNSAGSPSFDGLLHSVKAILALGIDDTAKHSELVNLVLQRRQLFADGLMEQVQTSVRRLAEEIDGQLREILAGLEAPSTAGLPHPAAVSLTLAMNGAPRIGIEARTVLSGLGRTAALFFLVQGNLPLAALSLVADLLGRMGPDSADKIVGKLEERLREEGRHVRDELIRRRHELSEVWQKELGRPFSRVFDLLSDLGKRASIPACDDEAQGRKADLFASETAVQEFRKRLLACRNRL